MDKDTLNGSCHCGAVTFCVSKPAFSVACNCSICRRYATLWVHAPPATASIDGPTRSYAWGSKDLDFHSCEVCGCITHWAGVKIDRIAVNVRLCDPQDISDLPIRHFDGANTWEFLD